MVFIGTLELKVLPTNPPQHSSQLLLQLQFPAKRKIKKTGGEINKNVVARRGEGLTPRNGLGWGCCRAHTGWCFYHKAVTGLAGMREMEPSEARWSADARFHFKELAWDFKSFGLNLARHKMEWGKSLLLLGRVWSPSSLVVCPDTAVSDLIAKCFTSSTYLTRLFVRAGLCYLRSTYWSLVKSRKVYLLPLTKGSFFQANSEIWSNIQEKITILW